MFKNWFCLIGFSVSCGKIDGLWGGTLKWDVAGIIILLRSVEKLLQPRTRNILCKTFVATKNLYITNY